MDLNTIEWTTFSAIVSPKQTGVYYFGIHDISDKMEYYMDVDDIAIVETTEEAPTGIATATGRQTAKTGMYNLSGQQLRPSASLKRGLYIAE